MTDEEVAQVLALRLEVTELTRKLESAREVALSYRRMYEQSQVQVARLRAKNGDVVPTELLEAAKAVSTEHVLKYSGGKSSGFSWACTCGVKKDRYIDKDVRTWDAVEHIASTIASTTA